MNSSTKKILYILVFNCTYLLSRQLLPPLPLHVAKQQEYHTTEADKEQQIVLWALGYDRHADQAFCADTQEKKCPLSALFFGKADFAPQEAFFNSRPATFNNPFVGSVISPRVKMNDHGVIFGMTYNAWVTDQLHLGFRAHVPWRSIRVTKTAPFAAGGQTVQDVFVQQQNVVEGTTTAVEDFALRLDFASRLPATCNAPGNTIPLVNYANSVFGNLITVGSINATEKLTNLLQQNPVTVVFSSDGSLPAAPFGILLGQTPIAPPNTARGLPILSADGTQAGATKLQNGDRARFTSTQNYTPLGQDVDAQSNLWLVPSVQTVPAAELTDNARIILRNVEQLLSCITLDAEQPFTRAGLSFADTKTQGMGDLHTEFFMQYHYDFFQFFEGYMGLHFPTSKDFNEKESVQVFKLPLGNNGHTGIEFGLAYHYTPCAWFDLLIDGSYTSILSAREHIPAVFAGSQLKNLGPITRANISWGEVQLHIDACMHMPLLLPHHDFALMVGYEFFHKTRDKVSFAYARVPDIEAIVRPVDDRLAARGTHITAHTFTVQGSYQISGCLRKFGTLHAGGTFVVGGSQVPALRGWFIGLQGSF